MLSTIAEIIRDLLIFVGVIAALLVVLLVVVSKLPDTNPLKRVLTALCYRLGATLAAGAVAIPLEPIPGVDVLYDVGVPIALLWYWWTFFRDARHMMPGQSPANQGQVKVQQTATPLRSEFGHVAADCNHLFFRANRRCGRVLNAPPAARTPGL